MQTLHVPAASSLVEHCHDCEPVLPAIFVNFNGSNFGITTWQHVLAVHSAADTAPPDDTTARPTIADRTFSKHRRCDERTRALCAHKPPPARSTKEIPTAMINRTVEPTYRYVCRRMVPTPRLFSSSSLSPSSLSSCARLLQPSPPSLLVTTAMLPAGGDRGDSGADRSVELTPGEGGDRSARISGHR